MGDKKVRDLPRRIPVTDVHSQRESATGRSLRRGQNLLSWIRIDSSGSSQMVEVDRITIMKRCSLPARDLRLLDPLFLYPSTILRREKAIVVNLEQLRCIITADEVYLMNSLDKSPLQYAIELQKRLAMQIELENKNSDWSSHSLFELNSKDSNFPTSGSSERLHEDSSMLSCSFPESLPFEFVALEVALEATCAFLDTQVLDLELDAFPMLDELTAKVNNLNLERARRLKSRLLTLTSRVQKVRDGLEQILGDDEYMAEMHLTEKKNTEATHLNKDLLLGDSYMKDVESNSAPISPVGSPSNPQKILRSMSQVSICHHSENSTETASKSIEKLEMLLEAYFVAFDATRNKLISLKEYIDDTEDFLNMQLDNVQNQLIQYELLLTSATFAVAVVGVVIGVFGMNIPIGLFEEPGAFKWVILISGVIGSIIFFSFLWFLRCRQLMPL